MALAGGRSLKAQVASGATLRAQVGAQVEDAPTTAPSRVTRNASSTVTAENQPATSRFKITGIVVDATTGAPVRKCLLTLSNAVSAPGRRRQRNAETGEPTLADDSGRFEIIAPSAGAWRLTVSARGYRTQAFDEHDGFSSSIVLTEAEPSMKIAFRLTPASRIDGYILDEAGEPVRMGFLSLAYLPPATPDRQHPRPQDRGRQTTDDRGYYRFDGLAAGDYTVSVQAQPWYATTAHRAGMGGSPGESTAPDPLDVVYPVEWYPGTTDFASATPITLHGGERRQANMRLLPVQGFHLHAAAETPTDAGEEVKPLRAPRVSYVTQVLPDGTVSNANVSIAFNGDGAFDIAGLAPGTYQLHLQGSGESGSIATVQIGAGSAHTLDLSQASRATDVAVKFAPSNGETADGDSNLQVNFLNLATQQSTSARRQDGGRSFPLNRNGQVASPSNADPVSMLRASLQPGTYEVSLSGGRDVHLTGIEVPVATASGATAVGRNVTLAGGAPVLVLHTASGRAQVTGFVRVGDKPVQGAMVLLVPSTLGDPQGLPITRRDQSNTDGSFDLLNVLPGTYILVAIDHGWDVNWSDPATLRGYLLYGTPLDLSVPHDVKETIEAVAP